MAYESLRYFADTWGLVVLVVIFGLMLVFIFRRGSTKKYHDAARIPMDAPEQADDRPISHNAENAERKD